MEVLEVIAQNKVCTQRRLARVPKKLRKRARKVKAQLDLLLAITPDPHRASGIEGLRRRRGKALSAPDAAAADAAQADEAAHDAHPRAATLPAPAAPAEPAPEHVQKLQQELAKLQEMMAMMAAVGAPAAQPEEPKQAAAAPPAAPPVAPPVAAAAAVPAAPPVSVPAAPPVSVPAAPPVAVPAAPPVPSKRKSYGKCIPEASPLLAVPEAGARADGSGGDEGQEQGEGERAAVEGEALFDITEEKRAAVAGLGNMFAELSQAAESRRERAAARPAEEPAVQGVFTRNLPGAEEMSFADQIKVSARIGLRKTQVPRSPGGTPLNKRARKGNANDILSEALRRKFRNAMAPSSPTAASPGKRRTSSRFAVRPVGASHHRRASSNYWDDMELAGEDKEN